MTIRTTLAAGLTITGLIIAGGAAALSTVTPADAQVYLRQRGQNRPMGRRGVGRTGVIAWSSASSRPRIGNNAPTGFYIWHDRNTVHVVSTDRTTGTDIYRGTVEIVHGSFDTLQNEKNERVDRFSKVADNRIAFRFDTQQSQDGFKFNLHGGDRIIFHIERDGRKTGRVYYGESKIASGGDPVVFNLKR